MNCTFTRPLRRRIASMAASLMRWAPRLPPKTNTVGRPGVERELLQGGGAVAAQDVARIGLPVTFRWSRRRKCERASTNDRCTSSAIWASQRLARPGTLFCSCSTTGRRSSQAASATGAAHVAAGAQHDVRLLPGHDAQGLAESRPRCRTAPPASATTRAAAVPGSG